MSLKVDEEKGLFFIPYIHSSVHTHTSAEVVEMVKLKSQMGGKSSRNFIPKSQLPQSHGSPVDIPEDDRFMIELPSKVNWVELLQKLRERQLHELKPGALDLIH
ncbi:unnamed protein product [Ambrosiozyma monospora]|uniref:Unnamed protein product n=1 Tax=Ambrosiozyma monospora TaxID=43982 RepID=A0ACB5TAV5_AMBMO|nr:unnamed protein product [Ambrosiozyma monospora]